MFEINKYIYVDKKTKAKFEVYSRTQEFADSLINRVNALGVFNLAKRRFRFCVPFNTEIPPYEIECEQKETVSKWEENAKEKINA
jgi:hypothetical protein